MGIASCVHGARKELLFRMKRNTLQKGSAMTMQRGYGVVNCESTLEEKYIAEERYNTLCARIYRYADSAYPDGAKIIACYLNGETLESTAKELHLTVRAVHCLVIS